MLQNSRVIVVNISMCVHAQSSACGGIETANHRSSKKFYMTLSLNYLSTGYDIIDLCTSHKHLPAPVECVPLVMMSYTLFMEV